MGIHSCPTNLGTGMRASVHVDLPGWTKESVDKLKARCEELAVQPRGTRGGSGAPEEARHDLSYPALPVNISQQLLKHRYVVLSLLSPNSKQTCQLLPLC